MTTTISAAVTVRTTATTKKESIAISLEEKNDYDNNNNNMKQKQHPSLIKNPTSDDLLLPPLWLPYKKSNGFIQQSDFLGIGEVGSTQVGGENAFSIEK